jgi:hypothetical protein
MMPAEKTDFAVNADLADVFNMYAAIVRRRISVRDFFTNQGPRFRPFFTRTIRHRRAGIGRSAYPAYRGDR